MRFGFIFLALVAGCVPVAALPAEPVVVEIRPVPASPPTHVAEVEDAAPPIKTWLSKEEWNQLQLQEAIEKAAREDPCQTGDPLCGHIRQVQ